MKPTQAQIEAAAKAIYDLPVNWRANKPLWQHATYQYVNEAKAALTAAAQAGEPVVTGKSGYEYVSTHDEIVAHTIERCAQVAEEFGTDFDEARPCHPSNIAEAIRALKDAP